MPLQANTTLTLFEDHIHITKSKKNKKFCVMASTFAITIGKIFVNP